MTEAKMIEYAASYRQVKNPYDNGDKDANAESRQVVGKLDDRAVSLNAVMDILNEIQADIEDGEGYDYHKWKSIVDELPSVTPQRPKGHWVEVYTETDYRNGWIEFSCPHCEYQHGLESGQYDWHFGDPIPWKACPICGGMVGDDNADRD